jgi:hypothetical protein
MDRYQSILQEIRDRLERIEAAHKLDMAVALKAIHVLSQRVGANEVEHEFAAWLAVRREQMRAEEPLPQQ